MMLTATIGLLFMSLAVSRPLWENVPLIEFVQFPWRFVGRAALPVAFLAGTAFTVYKQSMPAANPTRFRSAARLILPVVAVTLLLLEALPYLYPHYCLDEPFPTIQTVHAYEHNTGLVGVDPEGSYFPITVQQRPSSSPLEADYQAGQIPQRFDASQLPVGASIQSIGYGHNTADIILTTPESFQAQYLTFAFPGWAAFVDGDEVKITPTDPEGLITFPVPAGEHIIQIRWQTTPTRTLMSLVSLLCLVVAAITAVRLPVRQFDKLSGQFGKLPYKPLIITALLLLSFKLLIIDTIETPIRQETGPAVDNPAHLQANELVFAGYNLDKQSVPSGQTFDIDLAWQTLSQPDNDYQSNITIVGPEGHIWSDKETFRPRVYESTAATSFWVGGQWAWDRP